MAQVMLDTITTAFNHLKDNVKIALRTQLGDSEQLDQRIQACSRLLLHTNQVHLALLFLPNLNNTYMAIVATVLEYYTTCIVYNNTSQHQSHD